MFPSNPCSSSVCAAPPDDRDARHISLAGFGDDATSRLRAAHVLIIGVGGTGCAAAAALAAAGAGTLTLVDFDRIDASNLARQPLYTPADIGRDKVAVAATRLATQHPGIDLVPRAERLVGDALRAAVDAAVLRFYRGAIDGYWPPERAHVENGYRDIVPAWPRVAAPRFEVRANWRADDALDYLASWSSVRRCRRATGQDPVGACAITLRTAWGPQRRSVRWPLVLHSFRRPSTP